VEEGGCSVLLLMFAVSVSEVRLDMRERESCCERIDMEDWRGGLAKDGNVVEVSVSLVGRKEGLALGCREEFRRGEPTWPNADG